MSVIITNDLAIDLNNLQGKSFANIYAVVILEDGQSQTVKLTDIFDAYNRPYFVDGEISNPQNSFDEIVLHPNMFHIKDGRHLKMVDRKPAVVAMAKSTDLSTNQAKRVFGLSQSMGLKVADAGEYSNNTKLFVKLKGDKDFVLVEAKDVFVLVNGARIRLSELKDQTILAEIANNTILNDIEFVVNGRKVDEFDKAKFEQSSVADQEEFVVEQNNNEPVLIHKILGGKSEPVNDSVVKKSFVEDEDNKLVRSSRYTVDAERKGDHIYVENKQGERMFVKLEDLYIQKDGQKKQLDINAFLVQPTDENAGYLDFVGQTLLLKQGENYIELSPLTAEQATKVFANKTMAFTPTNKSEDVAKPGVYRKTTDGRYFEEAKIQPFCYDYAEGEDDFSHYLFVVNTNAGERTVIVSKTQFSENRRSFKINLNNTVVELSLDGVNPPRALKRVNKPVNKCAVVQTSNIVGAPVNGASVLKAANSEDINESTAATEVYKQFLADYAKGDYDVDEVYNEEGQLVELSAAPTRYKLTDYVEENDSTIKDTFYDNFEPVTLSLTNGKFKGKATFNSKKANKKYTKKALGLAKKSLTLVATPIGFLTLFAAPVLPVVAAGAVLSIPVARVTNFFRKIVSKRKVNNSLKNPIEVNRQFEQGKITKELQLYVKQIEKQWQAGQNTAKKLKGKDAYYTLNNKEFGTMLETLRLLQEKLEINFSNELAMGSLHVIDGVASINGQNAYLAKEYERLLASKNKNINKLKRQIKFARGNARASLQNQLADLTVERDVMMQDYTLSYKELPANQQAKNNCLNMINLARGLMVAKYNDYPILSDEEQRVVNSLNVDFVSGKVKFGKKSYKSIDELAKAKPDVKNQLKALLESGKTYGGNNHLDINNKKIEFKVEEKQNLVAQRAEQLKQEKVEEKANVQAAAEENKTSVQKLIKKLEETKDSQAILAGDVDKKIEQVNDVLKKENLTQDDESLIVKNLGQFEDGTKKFNESLKEFDGQLADLKEDKVVQDGEIDDMINMVDMFCTNIENCKENLNKIAKMFEGNLTATQARKLEKQVQALQNILGENQISVNNLVAKLETKLKVIGTQDGVDNDQVEKIEKVLKRLKNLSAGIQITEIENAKDEWKARYIESQKQILAEAAKTIEGVTSVEQTLAETGSKLTELEQKTMSNSIYGVKTAIENCIKGLNSLNATMKNQIQTVDSRMTSLANLQSDLKNDTDPDLIKVCEQAQVKVDEMNKKKAFVKASQLKAEELLADYKNLRVFVAATDIQLDTQKLTADPMFNSSLTDDAKGIKFLASVISNVKACVKLQKTLENSNISFDGDQQKRMEEFKTNMPNYLNILQQFIRENYNTFNTCKNEQVKEKYYKKIADYAEIDHSVVFTMPEGLMEADNQTESNASI